MTDDQFESFLQREARDYNAPPPVPRDEMWARIEAARHARQSTLVPHGGRARRWLMVGAAIAAMLLVGIGIGYVWRGTVDSHLVADGTSGSPDGARKQVAERTGEPLEAGRGRERGSEGAGARPEGGTQDGPTTRQQVVSPDERRLAVAPSPSAQQSGSRSTDVAASSRRESAAYATITAEHLGRVEALLTSYRAESESGKVDPQVTSWAGDLLGTTRLLLDSPGASDPRLHRLLGDLEMVLTQITQLSADQGSKKDELQLIDQSLRSHDVMTRIRGATPAGAGALPIGT